MASSSLISGCNPPKYDVFLSFRGEDTRNTFTGYLYDALRRSKIEAFIDNREVRTGDEISSSLSIAIRSSSLSIIIFSEDYASSSWCLNELLEILECNKTRGQIILPIFYHVLPSEIRKQTGTYGEAFAIHEERFKETKDKVQNWRTALAKVTGLSGTVINHHRPEPKFIDEIVEDVSRKLKRTSSGDYLDPGLVGITSRVERVESLLCIGMEDFCIIGIWGMGGIGKTTIAKAIFHRIAKQFESVCFLTDVKNEAKKGLQHLQETFLFKIFGEQNLYMDTFMVSKLSRKKILVVLDDVDDSEHLEVLADRNYFGLGSRIIITSRDRQVLYNIGGDKLELYNVEGLKDREALQLFNEKAFKQSFCPADYMELPRKFVSYCGGNPLALQVLGGSLFRKSMPQWNSLLDKLKKCPNLKIQEVLRISYDGLEFEEQQIFLFIACFFKGEDLDWVINILDCCEYSTEHGINVLLDKCLLTITKNRLMMHGLIQEMGHGIVIQESPKEPGKRSRLWDPRDIHNLFEKYTGTSEVESISLDLSLKIDQLYLRPDAFTKMPRLKLLKFYFSISDSWRKDEMHKVKILEGGVLESLPDDLRYLCWHRYPSKSLPFKFNPNHLVELDMSYSNLQHLWKDTKDLGKLRRIRLRGCEQLIEVPDLSGAPNLHVMDLYGCSNLTKFSKISRSVKKLDLSCTAVDEIPSLRHLTSLEALFLDGCSNITKFPQISGVITELHLSGTAIDEVPNSAIKSLNKLVELDLRYNTRLKNLPTSMIHLTSLERLHLDGCSNITKFPHIPGAITHLSLKKTAIEEVPDLAIKFLNITKYLIKLDLSDNTKLKNLPTSMIHLTSLKTFSLSGCSNITKFPQISGAITELDLSWTAIDEVPNSAIESLYKLACLKICGNTRLKNLPSMSHLTSLKKLNLYRCSNITEFPEISVEIEELCLSGTAIEEIPSSFERFTNIEELTFADCRSLKRVPSCIFELSKRVPSCIFDLSMNTLVTSHDIDFSGCSELENFPEVLENQRESCRIYLGRSAIKTLPSSIELLSGLKSLSLAFCKNLESLPNSLCNLKNLLKLNLSGCFGVEKMLENVLSSSSSSSSCLRSLRKLDLSKCGMLVFPSALSCLSSLAHLYLKGNNFESLSLEHFTSLLTLDISYCERLKYLKEFPLPSRLEFVDTSYCISLETLPDTTVATGEWDTYDIRYYGPAHYSRICQKDLIFFSGSEIPWWVRYQKDGSLLTIDLPPHRYINNFFGIVLCIVASCDSSDGDYSFDCTCNFIDSNCDRHENICYWKISKEEARRAHPRSDHVFVKYSGSGEVDSSMYSMCQKVRFQFSPRKDCCKVKKCGVHLVFGIQRPKHRE